MPTPIGAARGKERETALKGARNLKKRRVIIIAVILAVLLIEAAAFMAFCAYMDWKTEGRAVLDGTSLDTLKDCFSYA